MKNGGENWESEVNLRKKRENWRIMIQHELTERGEGRTKFFFAGDKLQTLPQKPF